MKIRDFQIGSERVQITFRNSRKRYFYLDENSGKAYYRYKTHTFDQVMHSGIYIGHDARGVPYYIHNHPEQGYASVVPEKDFLQEQELHEHPVESQFPQMEVLTRALEKAKEGEPYRLLTNNCQTFTNYSAVDSTRSEDVVKWSLVTGVLLASIASGITWMLTRSKRK